MKRAVFIISAFLIAAFLPIFGIVAVYGETAAVNQEVDLLNHKIEQKREKIKEIEAGINRYKKEIDKKRLEAVSLTNQMAILDNHIAQVELEVDAVEEKREALTLEIESLDIEIADAEKTIVRQRGMLAELLREMQFQNRYNFLEVAVLYDNFSDFFDGVQYVRALERDLGRSVEVVKESRDELTDKRDSQEERRQSYEKLGEELANRQNDLEEQTFAKSDLLAQTRASELTFQTMLKRLRGEYQKIENEISGIEQEVRRKLEEQNKLDNLDKQDGGDNTLLSWPTQSRYITARFRDPSYPYRHVFEHNAIDIRAAHGTPLKAAASGYVARARRCNSASCYAYVMLIHSDGISTVYGHMSRIDVKVDQFVARGDVIGYSGGTPGTIGAGPFVTGPHLHFEVRKDGIPVNPLQYLIKDY